MVLIFFIDNITIIGLPQQALRTSEAAGMVAVCINGTFELEDGDFVLLNIRTQEGSGKLAISKCMGFVYR